MNAFCLSHSAPLLVVSSLCNFIERVGKKTFMVCLENLTAIKPEKINSYRKAFYITCHIRSLIHRIIHGKGRHAGATCSSGVIQCFQSKESHSLILLSHSHTDETAIGSNLRFSILPKDTLTFSQGIQGLNHLPISGQLNISPEPQSPFLGFQGNY